MAATIRVSVHVDFNRVGLVARERVATAVAKTALDGEAIAKAVAPVDTGFLKSAIKAEQASTLSWNVTSYAAYSIFLEYGTRFMAAQPYMTPTAARLRPILQRAVASAI